MAKAVMPSVDVTRREVMKLARAIAQLGMRRRSLLKRLGATTDDLREKKKYLAGLLASSIGAEVTGGDDAPSTEAPTERVYPVRARLLDRRSLGRRARRRRSAKR